MVKDYELRDELDAVANDISSYNRNPSSWHTWMIYLLRGLEQKAMNVNPAHQEYYEDMLSRLQDSIRSRRRTGGW